MIIKHQLLEYCRGNVGNNVYMFTANSTIRSNGNLVMGAGNAKCARDTYYGIDKLFGDEIGHHKVFGVKFVQWGSQWIGAFQTKIDWQNKTPEDLLAISTKRLYDVATRRQNWTFHLPCPAINHGGMDKDTVLEIISILPDNVIVYLA